LNTPREKLAINEENLKGINNFLVRKDNSLVNRVLEIIEKHGGVEQINRKAREARKLENLLKRLENKNSPYLNDLKWLIKQRDQEAFIRIAEYRRKILGEKADITKFDDSFAVTLEISACNFFPWIIEEAKQAIARQDLMPARYIRVRDMKEQVEDDDILASASAMQIMGASFVQTLDKKGTMLGPNGQPVNVHLGGPETITGYFGGVGMPNECALEWIDEFLHYYTNYGIQQVLNVNSGTVLLGYWLHKLGIDLEFKISVYLGYDNPYSCLWKLMTAKLFCRDDGKTPLIGFNLSNSVNNTTIELVANIRKAFGFEDIVRIEHHIVETSKSIVRQPYDRLNELLEIADHVKNISAKHEGGIPQVEKTREHPSDILEYFIPKKEIMERGLMPQLLRNYLDKHDAVNRTAEALTKRGLTFIAAPSLHKE
jgi:DNA-binding phage protein